MSAVKAFVSDLDGTLLNADHSVPRLYDSLYQFLAARSVEFFVASARPLGNVRKLFEGHPVPTGIIACDGAIIARLKNGIIRQYKESSLSHAFAHQAFNAVRSAGVDPILFLTRKHDYTVAVVSRRIDETLLDGLRRSDPTRPIVSLEPRRRKA